MNYEQVIAELIRWAEHNDNVRGLVMTGSASAHETHLLSDRDIEVFARDVEPLLADESWWSTLGRVLVVERTENDNGQPTRLIYFTGGKLDFTLIAADELTAATYERPFTVLLDKDDQARSLRCVPPQRSLPDADSFHTCVNEAYAAALMCAKAVVRDELWPAKIRDEDLKWNLLQMIEWDHLARYGTAYDTRYHARRMIEWMDDDIRTQLLGCWGHLDATDTVAALRRTVDLFARLAQRTAALCDIAPFDHDGLHEEIELILSYPARTPG